MKLATSSAPLEIVGGAQSSSFSIAMNGKAFRVLSDTLYQNKIGSIVREISCNAYDAHIMANKADIPFVIHLPDAYEPWFSVQDFGVGLSPQDIVNVFTVYFQSTKDNSNDAVGAFGLGAKTPFSYTDQFTVTSIKDGVCYMYSAYITESGVPSIKEMGKSDTTEPNGVEIRMSVKREDYRRFAEEVASQLRFFNVKPVVKNGYNFSFKTVSTSLAVKTVNVAISNDPAGYGESWAFIVQGNVGYPLDITQIRSKITADNARLLDALNGSQVQFFFDIGQIGVTASREGIEYNQHTIANINAKLDIVRTELTDFINKQLANFTRDWDKAMFLNSSPALLRLARGSNITIANVGRSSNGLYYFDFGDVVVDRKNKTASGHDTVLASVKSWTHSSSVRQAHSFSVTPSKNNRFVFVLRDTANRPNIRAKHYLSQQPSNTTLVEIESQTTGDLFTPAFIDSLRKALGGYSEIIRISTIDPPVKVTTDGKGNAVKINYTRPTCYISNADTSTNIRSWTKCYDDLVDNVEDTLYVVVEDMAIKNIDEVKAIGLFQQLSQIFNNLPQVYGIREGDLKKIKDAANYTRLVEYVNKRMDALRADKRKYFYWRKMIRGNMLFRHMHYYLTENTAFQTINLFAPHNKVTKYLKKQIKYSAWNSDYKLHALAELLGWNLSKSQEEKLTKLALKIHQDITNNYPLVKIYNDWNVRSNINVEHLAKYLNRM